MDAATKSHTLYRKGLLLRMMSRPEDSIEVLLESLTLAESDDREVEILTALGDSYNMLGNSEEAIRYLIRSISLNAETFENYYNLVNIMKESGNATQISEWESLYEELSEKLKKFLKINKKKLPMGKVATAHWALFIIGEKISKFKCSNAAFLFMNVLNDKLMYITTM